MTHRLISLLELAVVATATRGADEGTGATAAKPLGLHPENPHYFEFRGRPTVLIGSGEHYGAVLNLDLDYGRYLDTVAAKGLNHTRTFSGVYCEPQGAFNIAANTLAPAPGKVITPWARSATPGYANGGCKFDLQRWDEAYFARLRDFVAQASARGIVVELDLFCPFYEDAMWRLSPMNAANNINACGAVERDAVYTLDRHGGLLAVHEALVRRIVTELNGFDNLYYEVCNEPYFGGVTMAWQQRMIDGIVATEKALPRQHLISLNIANGAQKVDSRPAGVSILNFHYASPPAAVALNYPLNCAIGDNETGFKGTGDTHYRMEGWEFILAGGALYSHLDYSFTAGHEDGSFAYPATQPGGGNDAFRTQMRVLQDFISGFDILRLRPDDSILRALPPAARARALVEPGRQYALYLFGGTQGDLTLALPPGRYTAQWVNPLSGAVEREQALVHPGGDAVLASPPYTPDIALRLRAAD
jgi:hypothetical protein